MKTLTLSAIALTLLASVANARDNDARDTWRWLDSVTQSHASAVPSADAYASRSDVAGSQQGSQSKVSTSSHH